MVKNAFGTIWKKLHNVLTLWALASLAWGMAMFLTGTFLPSTEWAWVTPQFAQIMSVVGFVFIGITVVLVILGIIKTKSNDAPPSFQFLIGIKKEIWELYKQQQLKVEESGNKGLTRGHLEEILWAIRMRLKANVIVLNSPLSGEATERIIKSTNKKLGVKNGNLSKKALDQLLAVGIVLDQRRVGVNSLIEKDTDYTKINDKLNIDRLNVKKDKEIKRLKKLAYTLNTILLSILFYEPIAHEIAPELEIPHSLIKEALDEEMQKQTEKF
jgi:hypothetical protein